MNAERQCAASVARRRRAASQPRVGGERAEHEQPGGGVADAGRQQRRQRLDHHRDAEVGRAPHDVDDEQREGDRRGRRPRPGARGHGAYCARRARSRSVHIGTDPSRSAACRVVVDRCSSDNPH